MIIKVKQRNTTEVDINISKGESTDLTGVSIYLVVVDYNGTIVIEKNSSVDDGLSISDVAGGIVYIKFTKEDTDLPEGTYKYEILLKDIEENRYSVLEGELFILPSLF